MKIIAKNRRAKYDYELEDFFITGVVLTGAEVKSAKAGHISLKSSYVSIKNGEVYLVNAHISPYSHATKEAFDETRERKLLLHKSEVARLIGLKQNGRVFVPVAVGIERGFIKLEMGVGRSRKNYDKRANIKKREAEREVRKARN